LLCPERNGISDRLEQQIYCCPGEADESFADDILTSVSEKVRGFLPW